MKLEHRFKSLEWSDSLTEYCQSRFQKISKYELKPVHIQITYSAERRKKRVEVNLQGLNIHYKANALTNDFYESVDKALQKIIAQMAKKKNKIQRHKNYNKSHEGRMEEMNNQFEPLLKSS